MLRGGYGIFYDSGTLIENSALYFNPPYCHAAAVLPERDGADLPRRSVPDRRRLHADADGQHARPAISAPAIRSRRSVGARARLHRHDADGALRRRASATATCASATSISREPGPGDLDPRRPIAGFGDILLVESEATSRYHALQLSACGRHARGLAFTARLHAGRRPMDDTSAFLATDGDDNTPQNSRNFAAEWGPSDFDVRHRAGGVGDLERAGARRRAGRCSRALAGERRSSPRSRAGRSRRASASTTATPATSAAARSPTIGRTSSPARRRRASRRSYGGQAFAIAPPFTFGNAGRNSLTGPGLRVARRCRCRSAWRSAGRARWSCGSRSSTRCQPGEPAQLPDSFVDRADVRPEPVGVAAAPGAARRALHVLTRVRRPRGLAAVEVRVRRVSRGVLALTTLAWSVRRASVDALVDGHAGAAHRRRRGRAATLTARSEPGRFTTLPDFAVERVVPAGEDRLLRRHDLRQPGPAGRVEGARHPRRLRRRRRRRHLRGRGRRQRQGQELPGPVVRRADALRRRATPATRRTGQRGAAPRSPASTGWRTPTATTSPKVRR